MKTKKVIVIMNDERIKGHRKTRGAIIGNYLSYRNIITKVNNKESYYM